MQEHDGIGILLDGTAFTQVRQSGLVILPILGGTVDLRQSDYGQLQLARQEFEPPRNGRHLFLPALAAIIRLDELQIINENGFDLMPFFEPAGVGGNAEHALARRIIDK
jgi:hypothetical protein